MNRRPSLTQLPSSRDFSLLDEEERLHDHDGGGCFLVHEIPPGRPSLLPENLQAVMKKQVRFSSKTAEYYHVQASLPLGNNENDDPQQLKRLWWTEEELDERCKVDLEIGSILEEEYNELLVHALDQCRREVDRAAAEERPVSASKLQWSWNGWKHVSPARGLETELCPAIPQRQEGHARAVLAPQNVLKEDDDDNDDEEEDAHHHGALETVLRQRSLKWSVVSSLLAQKKGEWDALQAPAMPRWAQPRPSLPSAKVTYPAASAAPSIRAT